MTPMTVSGRTIASAGVYLPYRFDLPRLPNLDFFLNAGFCIGGVNLFCLLEPGIGNKKNHLNPRMSRKHPRKPIVYVITIGISNRVEHIGSTLALHPSSPALLTDPLNNSLAAITKAITDTNNDPKCCPMPPAKIQKFTILPTDFSVVTDELTPTFKLKRSVAASKYIDAINGMYQDKYKKIAYIKYSDLM